MRTVRGARAAQHAPLLVVRAEQPAPKLERPLPPRKPKLQPERPPATHPPLRRSDTEKKPHAPPRQVVFTRPLPTNATVAIIGGGLSGLVCATELAHRGIASTVFDTGEHGVGGRLGTRSAADGSLFQSTSGQGEDSGLVFDHAAQYFTASDPAFVDMVRQWQRDGAVAEWRGPVGRLEAGAFTLLNDEGARYVGVGGMRRLAEHLARVAVDTRLVTLCRPQWVDSIRFNPSGWQVASRGQRLGTFDAVVIAHNGKCANRLSAPMGVPAVHAQLRRLKLSANWVLMAGFEAPLSLPFEGAYVKGYDALAWAGNNTAKLHLHPGAPQCWTLVSTQRYGKATKVPQESIPPAVAAQVTADMLEAFSRAAGVALPPPAFTRVQLWGAALPLNAPGVGCIWDAAGRVGVAGDWVLSGGSMQSAALSGMAMADRIAGSRGLDVGAVGGMSMGLDQRFKSVYGEEMGEFP